MTSGLKQAGQGLFVKAGYKTGNPNTFLVANSLILCLQAKNGIFLDQLDGHICLDGDRNQRDQILFEELEEMAGCVPEDMVAIQLKSEEFATRWKSMVSGMKYI